MKKTIVIVALVFAFAATGCKDDEKTYTCDEAMDIMYDEGCELWCGNNGSTVYLDQCAWWDDNDPANFSENLATDICEDLEDEAEDEDCMGEFNDMLRCLADDADDCAEDCDDAWEDLLDCVF